MSLMKIDKEDSRFDSLIVHGYTNIRHFPDLSLEETLFLAYIEALDYHPYTYNRTYAKSYLSIGESNNIQEYISLKDYITDLKDKTHQFGKFFDHGDDKVHINNIKRVSRDVLISGFHNFSHNFNVALTVFQPGTDSLRIFEHQYINPIEITVLHLLDRNFIVYKLDENKSPVYANPYPDPIPESLIPHFNSLGSFLRKELDSAILSDLERQQLEALSAYLKAGDLIT